MAEQSYPKLHTKKIISITATILNFFSAMSHTIVLLMENLLLLSTGYF